ncbi:SsgA family sporulation/cell division regulator [Streptomyces sp. NBC_01754]|uniref:SsgA family sporulation/cell division regulator n=1 Tax=Streptomyces sp. NBC_01754 TaxID=2975930 RepID=UPI002DD8AC26|nr:SsgA family sporulation/cell division regulator [Streptomyces sp. NBC_01754]WSC92957.1 SsgA family sporulation/cell division regulator [Streptomyces sp. NBC_01754]
MSLVIQEHLRARLVTDGPEPRLVPVRLSCDTAAPQTVRVHIPGAAELTLGRDVLESGLRSPVTSGGLRLWPCGRAQLVVERHTPDGVAVFQFDNAPLLRFLRRTYETHDTDATPQTPATPEPNPARPTAGTAPGPP